MGRRDLWLRAQMLRPSVSSAGPGRRLTYAAGPVAPNDPPHADESLEPEKPEPGSSLLNEPHLRLIDPRLKSSPREVARLGQAPNEVERSSASRESFDGQVDL